jgi:hypothetical protein
MFHAGFVDPVTNNFPNSLYAYCCDGFSIVIGALMGSSPVTVFVGEPPWLCMPMQAAHHSCLSCASLHTIPS